jgi:Tfp pilus assembly protein PilF
VQADATCEDGCAARGTLHVTSKRWLFCALALAVMLSACTSDPNKKKLGYLSSGEKYFKAGNYPAAEIEFRNAIALDPKFEQAHYQLAETYLKLSNLRQCNEITFTTTL